MSSPMLGEAKEEKWTLNRHSSNVPSYKQPVSSDSTAYLTRIKAQTSSKQLISPYILHTPYILV